MRFERHLVVFMKAPRLGAVKRRLARDVGTVAAWRFYRATSAAVLRRLARDRRWRLWLALTPDALGRADPTRPLVSPGAVTRLSQGRGDLGQRMSRVLRRLPPGPAVIVGADIPDISAGHIARAFAALGRHDAVFGPAPDGGYWLVGVRRRPCPPNLFRGVRWSTPHALDDTLANLNRRMSYALIERLEDVDDGAALMRWRRRVASARPICGGRAGRASGA